ncbi:MAG: HAD-IA family hydrolase [Gemmatimonadota bacterium]
MPVRWLVFDLGGVVVDFDPDAAWVPYARQSPQREAAICALVTDPEGPRARLSEGRISAAEYFAAVDGALGKPLSLSAHKAIDVAVLRGERPGMAALLGALDGTARLACCSNTHDLHWRHMLATYPCMARFEVQLASHLMGVRKPAPEAYEITCQRLGARPEECVFIDDGRENVEAARRVGMVGIHFESPARLVETLGELGLPVAPTADGRIARRRAVRALMLTPAGEVLLMRAQEPASGREVWFAPGGGMDGDETPEACLRRELAEETGRGDLEIGPVLWTRRHTFDWDHRILTQEETYRLVRTPRFEPVMAANPSPAEAAAFREFRWWTADRIAASDALFAPRRLAELVRDLMASGPPGEPFDSGV